MFFKGALRKSIKLSVIISVVVTIHIGFAVGEQHLRNRAQSSQKLYEWMLRYDAFTFVTTGGDSFGYNNYFKWHYAKSLKNKSWLNLVCWPIGILYDASDPPKEYAYPPQFQSSLKVDEG